MGWVGRVKWVGSHGVGGCIHLWSYSQILAAASEHLLQRQLHLILVLATTAHTGAHRNGVSEWRCQWGIAILVNRRANPPALKRPRASTAGRLRGAVSAWVIKKGWH